MSISYWLDQTTSAPVEKKHYDIVIVGGGIAGLSVAYWLQQKDSSLKIALLEKHQIGFGASGRNAGFVTCGSTEHFIALEKKFGLEKAVEIWKYSEENRQLLLEHVIEGAFQEVDFFQSGSCTVAPSEEHWQTYQKTAQTMRAADIDVQEMNEQEMARDYGVSGFVGGIQYTGDGYIHPVKLLQRLRRKLKCDIHENTEVFALNDKQGHQQLLTNQGQFQAQKIILTLNAYLPLVLQDFSRWIQPGRGQILVTEPLPSFVKGPCYLTKHLCYFRQLPTGHLLIGGFRNLATEQENTYADETTVVIQNALYDFVRQHFKYGPQAKIAYQWSGIMGFSPDGQMLIGSLPQNTNVHVMAGCSGHGMGLSFRAARTLVDDIFGQPIPSHLQLSRFAN